MSGMAGMAPTAAGASMAMAPSATASMAMAPSATASMSMGGMDMGGGMGEHACKISMLWNWYTVDSCFLAESWHVRSSGAFAGSCIGVIFLVISLEFLRRTQREFDRYLHRRNASRRQVMLDSAASPTSEEDGPKGMPVIRVRALKWRTMADTQLNLWQHTIRSFLYMMQFAVAYFVMLLAMYYNGYFIICIIIGAFLGALIFQWDTFTSPGYGLLSSGLSAERAIAC
ncbi:MAG: Copper Transporter integral membrane protein that functions in high affinity copper transport [Phylliscum demangeonii]|nr:MAG: Copper Transporter integral membrane protein that functions in high affinity copper transport [Phylliscum demangeonii]